GLAEVVHRTRPTPATHGNFAAGGRRNGLGDFRARRNSSMATDRYGESGRRMHAYRTAWGQYQIRKARTAARPRDRPQRASLVQLARRTDELLAKRVMS